MLSGRGLEYSHPSRLFGRRKAVSGNFLSKLVNCSGKTSLLACPRSDHAEFIDLTLDSLWSAIAGSCESLRDPPNANSPVTFDHQAALPDQDQILFFALWGWLFFFFLSRLTLHHCRLLLLRLHPLPQPHQLPLQWHLHTHQLRAPILQHRNPLFQRQLQNLLALFDDVAVSFEAGAGDGADDGDEGNGAGEDDAADGLFCGGVDGCVWVGGGAAAVGGGEACC